MLRLMIGWAATLGMVCAGLVGLARAAGSALPDEGQIGYVCSYRRWHNGLCLRDMGRQSTLVLDRYFSPANWSWSPTGEAYLSQIPGESAEPIRFRQLEPCQTFASTYGATWLQWSPDGRFVVYSGFQLAEGSSDILLMDMATGVETNLTDTPGVGEYRPIWTADGQHLFFIRRDGVHDTIMRINRDGGDPRSVFRSVQPIDRFRLSPDGRSILFGSVHGAIPPRFTVIHIDGGNPRDIPAVGVSDARWTPDNSGRILLALEAGETVVTDALTGQRRSLFALDARYHGFTWSPDRTKIAFTSDMGGDWSLYVANADGSALHQLAFDTGAFVGVAWSPDGRSLLFGTMGRMPTGRFFVVAVDGAVGTPGTFVEIEGDLPHWRPEQDSG